MSTLLLATGCSTRPPGLLALGTGPFWSVSATSIRSRNRDSMRAEGCLIEINAATNIMASTFKGSHGPDAAELSHAERFELDGQVGFAHSGRSSGEKPFHSEEVYVEHDKRLSRAHF